MNSRGGAATERTTLLDKYGTDIGTKAYLCGTHRTATPADTIARVTPMTEAMGITRVANVTGLDRIGIPVVMVCRPNSRSVAVSQGKGLDLDSAKASGLMEAIETWHAERMALPLMLAGYRELTEIHSVIDVDRLPRIDGSLYRPDLQILWVEGRNLLNDEPLWVPYEMVHSNYTIPRPTGHGCFPASTNGLASGNHFLEAACHAICEVIERDSTALWHHLTGERRAATRVDPDTVDDEQCQHLLNLLQQAGLEIAIWDTTTNIKAPSYYCLLTDRRAEKGHIGVGGGCHAARHIALARALTEAVQTRMTYIAGSRDDLSPAEFSPQGFREKQYYAKRMLSSSIANRDFRQTYSFESNTLAGDLGFLLDRLTNIGISEVACVDLTKSEYRLPVVRVVIPGLEAPHDEEDYVPGVRAHDIRRGRL